MITKKTLRDVYFDFVKLLEEKQKIVVSSEELSNILDTTPLVVNILIKALKNSKEISLIEKGDIYEISPIYRIKDFDKVLKDILKSSKEEKDSKEKEIISENSKVEPSQTEKSVKLKKENLVKFKLKNNEVLQGEFIEEDEKIVCLDSQKYRYLIYKDNILERENIENV